MVGHTERLKHVEVCEAFHPDRVTFDCFQRKVIVQFIAR